MNKKTSAALLLVVMFASGGCYKNEPVPTADFSYSGSNGFKVPCTIQFTNQSSQAFSYEWWFGTDSSVTTIDPPGSTLKNPTHLYARPGSYSVTLRSYTESRKEWASAIKTITIRDTAR